MQERQLSGRSDQTPIAHDQVVDVVVGVPPVGRQQGVVGGVVIVLSFPFCSLG